MNLKQVLVILVLLLFVNMPVVSALEISAVTAVTTDTTATITWDTDEPADSFAYYGKQMSQLDSKGDSALVINHSLIVKGLDAETEYKYKVASGNVENDNKGAFYSFKTKEKDTVAPSLKVELLSIVKGNKLDIQGESEDGAVVTVFVNGQIAGKATVKNAKFAINIELLADQENEVKVIAADSSGNSKTVEGKVVSDTKKPIITLSALPNLASEKDLSVIGTVSEESDIEVFLNNKSSKKISGVNFDLKVVLKEGKNEIKVVATDKAGWVREEIKVVNSDTQAPTVKFELAKGNEYFDGRVTSIDGSFGESRAKTDITGVTEPGAKVYLYVFQPRAEEFKLNFKRALKATNADAKGNFKFEEVLFKGYATAQLDDLAPKNVPSGLEDVLVPKLDALSAAQRVTYTVYILAEDQTGKVGYAKQNAYVNSCSSSNFDFDVFSPAQFPPQPFKLSPQLIEDGRESIQVVYNLTYRGNGVGDYSNPNNIIKGYRVSNVRFQPACTKANADSDEYELGCKLLPSSMQARAIDPQEKTMYYLTAPLRRADDFIDRDSGIWDDFVSKRMLKMPLKILVTYQERSPTGEWEPSKTQVECRDLGYFVDVPLRSSELAPDFLVDNSVIAINATLTAIDTVQGITESLVFVAGVTCYSSWLTSAVLWGNRVFRSYYESKTKKDEKKSDGTVKKGCPSPQLQRDYYLKDTITNFNSIKNHPDLKNNTNTNPKTALPKDYETKKLEDVCPDTASAWSKEAFFDKLYAATCDRFFCRAVPARWTEDKTEAVIKTTIREQSQCGVNGACISLIKVENCDTVLKANPVLQKLYSDPKNPGPSECWKRENGLKGQETHYYKCPANDPRCSDATKLETNGLQLLQSSKPTEPNLIALKQEGSGELCTAVSNTCANVCSLQGLGIKAANDGFKLVDNKLKVGVKGSCYKEVKDGNSISLKGNGGTTISDFKYPAGYTSDCFVDVPTGDKYQCYCQSAGAAKTEVKAGSREAVKKVGSSEEEWSYRQARIYKESGKTKGTYYPEYRYYGGRDWTGAFGFNSLGDTFNSKNKIATVDPKTQILGAWQTACVPIVNDQLTSVRNILIALRNCLIAANNNELADAGTCKAVFTRNVCGLAYKGISALVNECSPLTIYDKPKANEEESTTTALFSSLRTGVSESLAGSVEDLKDRYGAKAANQFKVGSQGLAQSMCLAALGMDFPTNFDFLTDSAYQTSFATRVLVARADREFTSFDPIIGKPTFTYNIAATIFPGCRIRGYRTTLECVTPSMLGNPGVDASCGGIGCDCLRADPAQDAVFASERSYQVSSGTKFGGIERLSVEDVKFLNPLKVSMNYRYDHVKIEIFVESGEDPANCFDEKIRTAKGGVIYAPISNVATKDLGFSCQVHPTSGRYTCPALSALFQGGQSYIEHPFVQCLSSDTGSFVDCQTPNNLLLNKEIVIKPYISLGSGKVCGKLTNLNTGEERRFESPDGISGPWAPQIKVGTVTPNMITGGQIGRITKLSTSDPGCGANSGEVELLEPYPTTQYSPKTLEFSYTKIGSNYQVKVPTGASVLPGSTTGKYSSPSGFLLLGTRTDLTTDEVNNAIFLVDGFRFRKVLGNPTPSSGTSGKCTYSTVSSSGLQQSNVGKGTLRVKIDLLEPGVGGSCATATQLMKSNALGKPSHTQTILLQSQREEIASAVNIHSDFMSGSYDLVKIKAAQVVALKQRTYAEATALYYWIAALVMEGSSVNKNGISSLLDIFFAGKWVDENKGAYQGFDTITEFQKMKAYLCFVDKNVNGAKYASLCGVTSAAAAPVTSGSKTKCEIQKPGFSCQYTGERNSGTASCEAKLCSNSILTARGAKTPDDWMCCPNPIVTTKTKCETTKPGFSCQYTTERKSGTTSCVSKLCENGILSARGVKTPADWMCCPE